ncbi:MAG: peptidoglycan DD-metalloendopeptidase family protein [Rhodobacteraceae bacterium]|nr:peptidoglycan DD-metalloendopeptidase family protein [Paracoccaceae bacterium]
MVEKGNININVRDRGLAHFLPRQTITLTDNHGVRSITLSPIKRLFAGSAIVGLVIWAVIATTTLVITSLGEDKMRQRSAVLTLAYETRLDELLLERDLLADQLSNVTNRVMSAQDELMSQQYNILQLGAEQQEMDANVTNLRDQLGAMLEERDIAVGTSETLTRELASVRAVMTDRLGGQEDIVTTIETITSALADAVETRDTIQADIIALNEQISAMELQRELSAQRQDRMLTQLEDAIEVSLVPLAAMFDAAGLDVDSLLANVQQNFSGTGGLSAEMVAAGLSPRDQRIDQILRDLDHVAMMNIAASKMPLAMPVRTAFRFTSGFGPRGGRMHKGVDLAGGRGDPIYTSGDGVVSFAGVQSGFGNLVVVNHGNGYETYYAHLNRIRTTVGTRVARGDRIADMGNTGRSTGVHLHYEIRVDGVSINPMTFIKAGRNVY